MSINNTNGSIARILADNGATILLKFSPDDVEYSFNNSVWYNVSAATQISGGTSGGTTYTFSGGIYNNDGNVYLDTSRLIDVINGSVGTIKTNKLDITVPTQGSNGITIEGSTIGVDTDKANTAGNLVVLPADGKIPEELLPDTSGEGPEYVPGNGINITGNTISAVAWEDLRI